MARGTKYDWITDGFLFMRWTDDVKNARRRQRITQKQLARRVGRSAALIARWEALYSMPKIPDFLFVCMTLNLDPRDYLEVYALEQVEQGVTSNG